MGVVFSMKLEEVDVKKNTFLRIRPSGLKLEGGIRAICRVCTGYFLVVVPCHWGEEVARVGQTIGADRAQVRQLEVTVEHFQNVSSKKTRKKTWFSTTCAQAKLFLA